MEITDPNVISQLAAQFTEQPAGGAEVKTILPTNNVVRLAGGYVLSDGTVVRTVEVRELTGVDEEALASTASTGSALLTILTRGIERVDGRAPRQEDFDSILLGDIETVILNVYIVTFGPEVTYSYGCKGCGAVKSGEVNLLNDIKYKELTNPATDSVFEVQLKSGTAVVSLPNGITQRRLQDIGNATEAEITTAVLSGCLVSVNGNPSMGVSTAKSLSMSDRAAIAGEIMNRTPGPRLGEVVKACEACSTTHVVPLSLAGLFRV
jgi:hypothetical protein